MTHEQLQALLTQAEEETNKGNYDQAETLAKEVLSKVPSDIGDGAERQQNEIRANATRLLGWISYLRSDYPKALEHLNSSLLLSEETADKAGIAKALGNIGNVHKSLSDYPKALEYYSKALSIDEELGNKKGVAIHLGSIGIVHQNLSDYPKALEYYGKALSLDEEIGNKAGVASSFGNIGVVHENLSDYPKALEYLSKALSIDEELGNKKGVARHLGNIGNVHRNLSDYPKALEYYGKALSIDEELGNKKGVATHLGNIGNVHQNLSDYPKALEYYSKALTIAEELGNKALVASCFGNIGIVHHNLSDYPKALEYYGKALSIDEEIGNKEGVARNLGNIGLVYMNLSDYPKALEYYGKALSIAEDLGNKQGVAIQLGNIGATYSRVEFEGFDAVKAEEYLLKAVAISTEIGYKAHLAYVHKILSNLYEHEKRWENFAVHFKKHIAIEKEINIEEVKKQESIREQQKAIEIERTRATAEKNILNNILPEEITQRLIKGENPIADSFDSVSILFMDIVDFTRISTTITAQQLVHLLNAIFTAADGVMREFGLEKIKTIGDAYMAVAGAPIVQADHAHRAAHAALKLLEVMQNLVVTFPEKLGDKKWIDALPEIHVRIGVHCGSAAAGVVGENKFLYDLWGDAVNTAARMESHGEAGKIHCSEEFKNALAETHGRASLLNNVQFISRGEMEIKGKGMMRTYFLERA